jgi:hypothetical protein
MKISTLSILSIIFVLFLAGTSCQRSDAEIWSKVKKTLTVYPTVKMRIIRDSMLHQSEIIWVDDGYKDYPYKKFCDHRTTATFDISQPSVSSYLGKDSLGIAHLLAKHFQSAGIAHFVAQTLITNKLLVYLYAEEDVNPLILLDDFKIPVEATIENDETWSVYGKWSNINLNH